MNTRVYRALGFQGPGKELYGQKAIGVSMLRSLEGLRVSTFGGSGTKDLGFRTREIK